MTGLIDFLKMHFGGQGLHPTPSQCAVWVRRTCSLVKTNSAALGIWFVLAGKQNRLRGPWWDMIWWWNKIKSETNYQGGQYHFCRKEYVHVDPFLDKSSKFFLPQENIYIAKHALASRQVPPGFHRHTAQMRVTFWDAMYSRTCSCTAKMTNTKSLGKTSHWGHPITLPRW